ncbi:contact-dependent growth inhibition system immunity protein [Streptomyces sp. NPDC029216]|uniref:contact-dependent growth inhibition system immunity protein n=1 Tax=Streptomyces sp. NPDC029216 TaxID=3154701 RepID=UPI0033DB78E0
MDPPRWAPPGSDATQLVRKVHELRRLPLGQLGPADLRTLISQQVALPYVLPLAVRLLLEEPLLDAYFYEGDLLLATVAFTVSLLQRTHDQSLHFISPQCNDSRALTSHDAESRQSSCCCIHERNVAFLL